MTLAAPERWASEQLGCTSAEMKLHFTSLSVLMAVMKRRDLLRNLF